MKQRFVHWFWQMLIAIDQLLHVWLAGFTYVWFGRGSCPNADETISSRVGRAAIRQTRWGLFFERIINTTFSFLGDEPDHCRRSVEIIDRRREADLPGATSPTPG